VLKGLTSKGSKKEKESQTDRDGREMDPRELTSDNEKPNNKVHQKRTGEKKVGEGADNQSLRVGGRTLDGNDPAENRAPRAMPLYVSPTTTA